MDLRQVERAVARLVAPLKRRVLLTVGRAVLTAVNDATKAQSVQLTGLADEVCDDVERFQEYGFTSVPLADCEAVLVAVGGNRAHGIVVATEDRRYRPTGLAAGEVALYTSANGKRVFLKADGTVNIGTSPSDFVALATLVKNEITALRNTVNSLVSTFNAHGHTGAAVVGGVTGTSSATVLTGGAATAPAAVGDVKATEVKAK
jgi:phage baseplate assembly protein V